MAASSNSKLDVDPSQCTLLPWGVEVMTMLGHVSELESELLCTRTESISRKTEELDLAKAFWFVVALAAYKPVTPSSLRSWLEVDFGEKTDPARNSQKC